MKSIMVDMDNVLTDGNFGRILEDYLGYKPDYSQVKGYYVQDILGDKKDDFFSVFKDLDMYEGAELFEGCYDALKELNKYYKIYVCTDYIWREIPEHAGNNLRNKYNYLYKKLDFLESRSFIFACDKSVINCGIKIDDRIHNIEGAETKLLYTAYHNKEITNEELSKQGIIRVNNWQEIKDILLKDVK